jgi:hypothetical protein
MHDTDLQRNRGSAVREHGQRLFVAASWTIWVVFVAIRLRGTAAALAARPSDLFPVFVYVDFVDRFWAGLPVYLPESLTGFHYLPVSLLLFTPLSWTDLPLAGVAFGVVAALAFTAGVHVLMRALFPGRAAVATGIVLLASIMPASHGLGNTLAIMVGAMMAASAAAIAGRWRLAALWLALAVAVKPLAMVMALLVGALVARTRAVLLASLAVLLVLPFAFRAWGYLAGEYAHYLGQLLLMNGAPAGDFVYQAEISTLLARLGLDLPQRVLTGIRLLAALGTLVLAYRVVRIGDRRASALALSVLSAAYIALFNPRQEWASYLVITPPLAVVALLHLDRDRADWRGWLWLALALLAGSRWAARTEPWLKPAVMLIVWAGLVWMMLAPARWIALTGGFRAGRACPAPPAEGRPAAT